MHTEISKAKYPYEMFCIGCGWVPAFLEKLPEDGEAISSKGAIMRDGNPPTPGSEIICLCPSGTPKAFDARERTDNGRVWNNACGECGSTTNPTDRQCLKCGCAVCVKCTDHEQKC